MKHTPEPWVSGGDHVTANGRTIVFLAAPRNHTDASDVREQGESWLDAYERLRPERDAIEAEMQANARLIAAAPMLLAEMKRYLPVLEELEKQPGSWEWCTGGTGIATLNGYRAAIAKAEGVA